MKSVDQWNFIRNQWFVRKMATFLHSISFIRLRTTSVSCMYLLCSNPISLQPKPIRNKFLNSDDKIRCVLCISSVSWMVLKWACFCMPSRKASVCERGAGYSFRWMHSDANINNANRKGTLVFVCSSVVAFISHAQILSNNAISLELISLFSFSFRLIPIDRTTHKFLFVAFFPKRPNHSRIGMICGVPWRRIKLPST